MNTESSLGNLVFSSGHFTWVIAPKQESFESLSYKGVSQFYCIWIFSFFLLLHHRDWQNSWCVQTTCENVTAMENVLIGSTIGSCLMFTQRCPKSSVKLQWWVCCLCHFVMSNLVLFLWTWCSLHLFTHMKFELTLWGGQSVEYWAEAMLHCWRALSLKSF